MQSAQQPALNRLYLRFLDSENSADFIQSVSRVYTLTTLQRLAVGGDRIARRAAVLALTYIGGKESAEVIGRALSDNDRAVRLLAQDGIRSVWNRIGSVYARNMLQVAMRYLSAGQTENSIDICDILLETEPQFAEIWNHRAISFFEEGRVYEAIAACQQTLELNPYHFPAATGLGHCYLELADSSLAIEHFQYALSICPDLEYVRSQINQLHRSHDS